MFSIDFELYQMKPGCSATPLAASTRPRLIVEEVKGILEVESVVINQLGSLYNLNKLTIFVKSPMICYSSVSVEGI